MADTGWVISDTQANVDRSGGTAWGTPTYAETSNNSHALCALDKMYDISDWLRVTNFDFSAVPADATLDGIEVRIERKASLADRIAEVEVELVLDGVEKGDSKDSEVYWPTSDTNKDYGGASDTWNSGLTIANIKDSGFGMQVSAMNADESTGRNAYVDCIWIKIHYTEAAVTFIPRIIGII